jgi:Na+-driven multidrug efflux pump
MAVQVLWASIEQMLMISLVNRYGAHVTAAYGAVVQLWNLIMMPAAALGVAMTATVAQNIGARRWDRIRKVTGLGLTYSVLATGVLVAITEALGAHVCRVFLPTGSPALAIAAGINQKATWSLIPVGGYMVWVGVLRATGTLWAPLVISAAVLGVRFPVTAALLGRWQAQAIWWSFPASASATMLLLILHAHFCSGLRRALSGRRDVR